MNDKEKLTKEERENFLKSLQSGELDDAFKSIFDEKMEERAIPSAEKEAKLAKINEHILASHDLMTQSLTVRRQRTNRFLVCAAAAIVVLTTIAGLWTKSHNYFTSGTEQLAEAKPLVFSEKHVVKLPDGSTVLLNENSELSFKQSFGTSTREVSLIGEALFDVSHDPAKPFIVRTGSVSITVLGTKFNINAEQTKIRVTVVRGLVQVGDDHQIFGKISPDEQMEVDVVSNDFVMKNVRTEEVLAWQEDFIMLDNVTFAQAAEKIEKQFNVKVIIANESLKECIVNAWFLENENLMQIVEGISAVQQATAIINGDSIIIEGGIGCKPSH
jgi:ferric-dicitrate binding protein FerR (iron transport regulator)